MFKNGSGFLHIMASRAVLQRLVMNAGPSFYLMGYADIHDAKSFAKRLRDAENHVAQFVVLDDGSIDWGIENCYRERGIIKFPVLGYKEEHGTEIRVRIPTMVSSRDTFHFRVQVFGSDLPIYEMANRVYTRIETFLKPYHLCGDLYP